MNRAAIVTRPFHDPVTKYLHVWSKQIVDLAKAKNIDVHDLSGQKANRDNFESYVKKHQPGLVFLNGHGNPSCITGDDNKPIVDMTSDVVASVVYARSCEAGTMLGPKLITGNTKTFIGYRRKFTFMRYTDKSSKPLEDSLAALFLEPSNLVVSTLLKDHSAEKAYSRSQEAMRKNFRKMLSSAASYEERYAARWMWANIKSQVILGDAQARI